jgi:hemerythrin superfamily protein
MSILETLKKDHQKVLALLDQLINAEKSELKVKQKLVAQIQEDLIPHARAEEAVLYNSLREIPEGKDAVSHAYREHVEVESILRSLQITEALKIDWVAGAKSLKRALSHHIDEEEGKVFSAARQLFTEVELEAMAEVFTKMKSLVKKQSFIGTSMDALVNMMPGRLREAFGRFSLEHEVQAKVS